MTRTWRGWAVGGAVVVLATTLTGWTQLPIWGTGSALAIIRVLVTLAFALTGMALLSDPDQHGNARLFFACACLWALSQVDTRDVGALPIVGVVAGVAAILTAATVLLRFPRDRLTRPERWLAAMTWGVFAITTLTSVANGRPTWFGYGPDMWWPPGGPNGHWFVIARGTEAVVGTVAGAIVLVAVARRWWRTPGIERFTLVPAVAATVVVIAATVALLTVRDRDHETFVLALTMQSAAFLLLPLAFLAVAARRHLARAGVADLVLQLERSGGPGGVRDALRTALRDPELEVLYWLPDSQRYVALDGRAPSRGCCEDRLQLPIETDDGRPLAMVVMTLCGHVWAHELVAAALAAARLTLRNGQLQAQLQAQLTAVQEAQARLVHAGFAERSRLERDLHDGAQQRLLALSLRLGAIRASCTDPLIHEQLERARTDLRTAMGELRDLAHGLRPRALAEGGLAAALEAVVERLAVPIRLAVPDRRWGPDVETTAYFVACEALANAAKHAGPCTVEVSVDERAGWLEVAVVDTGGGSDLLAAGGGLTALKDRLAAVGGRLRVESLSGWGTRVFASIPCG